MLTGFDKDGGWGQIYLSCPKNRCVPLEGNQSDLLQTTWAMMSLISFTAAKLIVNQGRILSVYYGQTFMVLTYDRIHGRKSLVCS
ncbi:beta-amyrin synthase [Salix suchowensis]|nr:beta-amyrin synthase [Salix suchowensis]